MGLKNSLVVAMLLLPAGVAGFAQETPAENPSEGVVERQPKDEKPASFAGMVVNGVTGEPVAHVQVYLSRNAKLAISDYRALTGTDGRFLINGLKPERYFIGGGRRGYSPPNGAWFGSEENDPKAYTLGPGEEIKDIVVKLVPDSAIAGQVVDSDGVPMEFMPVEAVGATTSAIVHTDDRGEFRIGGLHPGRYLVRASPNDSTPPEVRTDGSVPVNYSPTWYPSSAAASSATLVTVQAGLDTEDLEIKMLPAPVLHISGQVSGEIRGASLSLRLSNGFQDRIYGARSDGKFTLWRVPPGRYLLMAESLVGGRYMRSAPAAINLTKTSIEGVNLAPEHPVDLTLKMEGADLQRFKEEADGLSVRLIPVSGLEHPEGNVSLNPDRVFHLPEVWPGRYHVLIEGLPNNAYVKSVRSDRRDFPDGVIELSGRPAKLEMVLEMGTDGAEISGAVGSRKGDVHGYAVALFFDDAAAGAAPADSTLIADDGSYVFRGVAPGKYKLLLYEIKNRFPQGSAALEINRDLVEKVEVSAGETKRVDLKAISGE